MCNKFYEDIVRNLFAFFDQKYFLNRSSNTPNLVEIQKNLVCKNVLKLDIYN
jgi:hypothetical protein